MTVAMASGVFLHGSGRTAVGHQQTVLGVVSMRATSFAQCRTAVAHDTKASPLVLVLVLRVLLLTPAPSALEGRLAPILVVIPSRSSHVRASDLQTVQYNAGCNTSRVFVSQVRNEHNKDSAH